MFLQMTDTTLFKMLSVLCIPAAVVFVSGNLTTSSYLAEYKMDNSVTFTATFISDPEKASIEGDNLWQIEVFASNRSHAGPGTVEDSSKIAPRLASISSKKIQ